MGFPTVKRNRCEGESRLRSRGGRVQFSIRPYFIYVNISLMKIVSNSLIETKEVAEKFLQYLRANQNNNGATVIGMEGDLGSGKTTLTKSIADILGINETITSPTFVIQKSYEIKNQNFPWKKLIHIDAYRLSGGEELLKLGFGEEIKNKENLIIVEWPELVKLALPENIINIFCGFIGEDTRAYKW